MMWQTLCAEAPMRILSKSLQGYLNRLTFISANDTVLILGIADEYDKVDIERRWLSVLRRLARNVLNCEIDFRLKLISPEDVQRYIDVSEPVWEQMGVPPLYFDSALADLQSESEILRSKVMTRYLNSTALEQGVGLVITGPPGTGKTTLAVCLLKRFVRTQPNNARAFFVDARVLIDEVLHDIQGQSGTGANLMRRAHGAELLVLDDLKVTRLTEWSAGKIDDLIRARLNAKRITVITSNESWNILGNENSKLDVATKSRLASSATIIDLPLDSKDWRLARVMKP